MGDPDHRKGDHAVESHFFDRFDCINFDDGSVVRDIATKNYENYCAHETRDFEDDNRPPYVFLLDNILHVPSEYDCMAKNTRDRFDKS